MTEKQKKEALEHYNTHQWCKIEKCIPEEYLSFLKKLFVEERIRQDALGLLGKSKDFGSGIYWQGLDSLSKRDAKLFDIYTSDFIVEILKLFMKSAHCFIEEAVIKMPKEDFYYTEHIDRVGGTQSELYDDPLYNQITVAWVLDDLTENNGTLEVLGDEGYYPVYANSGDLLIWGDKLWHRSGINSSEEPRCLWINFFTEQPIGTLPQIDKDYYDLKLF
jgi:hypothetical protein